MICSLSKIQFPYIGLSFLLLLSACSPGTQVSPTPSPTLSPTNTPVAVALIVNGESLIQAEFNSELRRYIAAQEELGITASPEAATQVVLNDFIDQILLSQSASVNGYYVDNADVQARIDVLVTELGGLESFAAWQAANGYTDAEFRSSLKRQMAAVWMRDQVIASVPTVAEQVHVRQIMLYTQEEADEVYALLQTGQDFDVLAGLYEPVTRGELGWFPRGYLIHPSIEEAAFALQPGQFSTVIESSVGYHILYLLERDPARDLSPDALIVLQESVLQDWLIQQRDLSTIIVTP